MGYFSEEFEQRHEELMTLMREEYIAGRDPQQTMPEEWAELEDMEAIINTEFF